MLAQCGGLLYAYTKTHCYVGICTYAIDAGGVWFAVWEYVEFCGLTLRSYVSISACIFSVRVINFHIRIHTNIILAHLTMHDASPRINVHQRQPFIGNGIVLVIF